MVFIVIATGKVGFIQTSLTLIRVQSPLQPSMTPISPTGDIMYIGSEETIFIDTSKS